MRIKRFPAGFVIPAQPVFKLRAARLKMPRAGALRTRLEGLLARTHAPAEPPGQAAKEEANGAKQCGARHRLSRCVGGLRHLLLSLIYCVPILLGVLLNLRASILHGDILRTCYHLSCTFPRFCRLLWIAGDNRTHGYDSCISQGRWIIPRDRASDRLLD